jgi:hypothetical protein
MNTTATSPRRRSLLRLAAIALAPVLSLPACGVQSSSATTTLTSTVADAKSAVITIENGKIEVIKDPSATSLQITAEVRCFGKDQAEADSRLKAATLLSQRDSDGEVRIAVNVPKRAKTGLINLNSDVTHITVRAADLSAISATTSNGAITIGAFTGPATLETSNGAISVTGHDGPVKATTSNGSITIEGARSVVAETSNGKIDVTLREGATGDLSLETSNGSITLELAKSWEGTVTGSTSLGSVNLSGGTVSGKGESKSMKIGDATKAKATVETSLGSVTVRPAKQ